MKNSKKKKSLKKFKILKKLKKVQKFKKVYKKGSKKKKKFEKSLKKFEKVKKLKAKKKKKEKARPGPTLKRGGKAGPGPNGGGAEGGCQKFLSKKTQIQTQKNTYNFQLSVHRNPGRQLCNVVIQGLASSVLWVFLFVSS